MRDERVGVASTSPGSAIGECRIYDYNLESQVFEGPESEYTLRLFDIAPYTKIETPTLHFFGDQELSFLVNTVVPLDLLLMMHLEFHV